MAFQDLKWLETNCNDFGKLCAMCEGMERRWSVNPALKVEDIHFNTHFRSSRVDKISCRIILQNYASQSYVPVATT